MRIQTKPITGIISILILITYNYTLVCMTPPPPAHNETRSYFKILEDTAPSLGIKESTRKNDIDITSLSNYTYLTQQQKKYSRDTAQFMNTAFDIMRDSTDKAAYNQLLDDTHTGEFISPTEKIFWEPVGNDYALKKISFDRGVSDRISITYIDPDYPRGQLYNEYFSYNRMKQLNPSMQNPEIGKNQNYRQQGYILPFHTQPQQTPPQSVQPQYPLQQPQQPQPMPYPQQFQPQQPHGPYNFSPGYSPVPSQPSYGQQPFHQQTQTSILDNPNFFQVLAFDNQQRPYGWLTIKQGDQITNDNAVLAIRDRNHVIFVTTKDLSTKSPLFPLPKGLWHWRDVPNPSYGYVRITPTGYAWTYDVHNQTWKNSSTGDIFRSGKHTFPNKATEDLFK